MMVTVTSLATHLLKILKPEGLSSGQTVDASSAAQLALYGFLKNFCEPGEPLQSETLERFIRWSLNSSHWNQNKEQLFRELANCLQHYSNATGEALPLCRLHDPSEIQVLHLESRRSLIKLVEERLRQVCSPVDQTRLLEDERGRVVALRLDPDRKLSVFVYDQKVALIDGVLEPLLWDHAIHYSTGLNLDSLRASFLEVADNTFVRFKAVESKVQALAVRGYTFNKVESYEGDDFNRFPVLFYPLKRLERLFVNKNTDPLYLELTGLLEKATEVLRDQHPEAISFAEAALERGLVAFEQVYLDDKMLRLLLENLERALELRQRAPATVRSGTSDLEFLSDSKTVLVNATAASLDEEGLTDLDIDPYPLVGPDLVELQEAEPCEILKPNPGL